MIDKITWSAGGSTDIELLENIPENLRKIVESTGGFILDNGAIHFRGCTHEPEWNSLRHAYLGESSFKSLYPELKSEDIPFAQDQFGDQFILRDSKVFFLEAETGVVINFANSLDEFLTGIDSNIENYLNIASGHILAPGELLQESPPFCTKAATKGVSLKSIPALELIQFHADLAKQMRSVPNDKQIEDEIAVLPGGPLRIVH